MNIDFIKWMVGYADGFEIINDNVFYDPNGDPVDFSWFSRDDGLTIWYPLLLQRAIEGINKHDEKWSITQYPFIITVVDYDDNNIKFGDGDIGQSQEKNIEQALKYIWEKEK